MTMGNGNFRKWQVRVDMEKATCRLIGSNGKVAEEEQEQKWEGRRSN